MLMNKEFEDYLLVRVQENDDSRTKDAMAYSLMNGGKRVRHVVVFCTRRLWNGCSCWISLCLCH